MKQLGGKARTVPKLAWLVYLALLIGPLTTRAKDSSGDAARHTAERLKAENFENLQQFESAAKEATKAGAPAQSIAEAKLVFCCANNITGPLPSLIQQLRSMLPNWKESDSLFFQSAGELQGLVSYAQALLAEQANDESAFEKSMKDAFWQDPEAGSIYGKKIVSHRKKQREANLVLPMSLEIPLSNGGQTSLAELVKGHKAVLLDFWASWCGPCMSLMGELRTRAHKLAESGIMVAGIDAEAGGENSSLAKATTKAESVRKAKKMDLPWLVEPAESPLSRLLEIDTLPRMVLVSPEGKILYNGHPSDPALTAALSKLDGNLAEGTSGHH